MSSSSWNPDKYNKYVAYIDILGYSSIIFDNPDHIAYHIMTSVFENYIHPIEFTVAFDEIEGKLFTDIKRIAFSDCLYLSTKKLPCLFEMLVELYTNVYHYRGDDYDSQPTNWMPYLRSGIEYGWVQEFRDPTYKDAGAADKMCYRNPVGSGIAKAYLTTEKKLALPGMRIAIHKDLLELGRRRLPIAYENLRTVCSLMLKMLKAMRS